MQALKLQFSDQDRKVKKIPVFFLLLLSLPATLLYAQRPSGRTVEPRAITPRGALLEAEKNLITLFEQAAPSVAYITTERLQRTDFFTVGVAQGSGSAFVWDAAGYVVTNFHVIENARKILVRLDADKEAIAADYVGGAPDYDLAVVKLKQIPHGLRPIPLGTSRDLRVGQSVIAIGNPFGFSRTLTTGIISALDRYLPTQNYAEIAGAIQTDAAINPGNSGGPLLDSAGRLIGVNTSITSSSGSSAGVGFSIPVDLVNRIVPQLIARGRAASPSIGIVPYDPWVVARNGIKGVVINGVRAGTPAAQAGLKPLNKRSGELGDIITAVNGRPVETLSTFVAELDRAGIGNLAEFVIRRNGKERREKIRIVDAAGK
jgi:2-alkenal reductase